MKDNRLVLQGKIEGLRFRGQESELPVYSWEDFDINFVKPACKVVFPDGTAIALSRWKGPKRTRTYPLASVYETYSFRSGKIITVIPIIKDEGADTNLELNRELELLGIQAILRGNATSAGGGSR